MKRESKFQSELIRELETRYPGCIVLKNDPNYIQGIPDLTFLYKSHWAFFECKRFEDATKRTNQPWYIQWAGDNSFGAFIYPENKEEVLYAMERSFGIC